MFDIYMDNEKIHGERLLTDAFVYTFALHYVFNLEYQREVSNLLEFVQRFFFAIHPPSGTRSKKKDTKKKF